MRTSNAWTPEALMARKETARRQLFHLIGLTGDDLMFPAWADRDARQATVCQLLHLEPSDNGLPMMTAEDRRRFPVIMAGVDLSSRKRKGVFVTIWCRDAQWRKYPLAAYSTSSAAHAIDFLDGAWNNGIQFSEVIVENNATQDQIVQLARVIARERSLQWQHRIKEFTTGVNKLKEDDGLPAINALIHGREIVWPEREIDNPVYGKHWREFYDGFKVCPRFPEPNCTPDPVMSSWFALRRIEESHRTISGKMSAVGLNGKPAITPMGAVGPGRFNI